MCHTSCSVFHYKTVQPTDPFGGGVCTFSPIKTSGELQSRLNLVCCSKKKNVLHSYHFEKLSTHVSTEEDDVQWEIHQKHLKACEKYLSRRRNTYYSELAIVPLMLTGRGERLTWRNLDIFYKIGKASVKNS